MFYVDRAGHPASMTSETAIINFVKKHETLTLNQKTTYPDMVRANK